MEVDMPGAENDEPEMSFRHGYQQGAIEVFCAIERFLDPTTREVLQAWIEKDVFMWRAKAMLGHPPTWGVNMFAGSKPAGGPPDRLDPKESPDCRGPRGKLARRGGFVSGRMTA